MDWEGSLNGCQLVLTRTAPTHKNKCPTRELTLSGGPLEPPMKISALQRCAIHVKEVFHSAGVGMWMGGGNLDIQISRPKSTNRYTNIGDGGRKVKD